VHVVDASRPEPDIDVAAVDEVLGEIGATEVPRLLALNKSDLLDDAARDRLRNRFPDAIAISAVSGEGVEDLLAAVGIQLEKRAVEVEALVPYTEGTLIGRLHDEGRIMSSEHEEHGVRVRVKARPADLGVLEPYLDNGATRGDTEPT
jgi:GTP-binding protein HflX